MILTLYIMIQKKKLHIHPKVAVDYSEDPQKKESINISSQKIRYSSLARFGGVTLFLIYLGYISSKIQVEKVDSEEFLTQQNNSNTNELVSCPPKKMDIYFQKTRQIGRFGGVTLSFRYTWDIHLRKSRQIRQIQRSL